jgi:plastocyanin
MLVVFLLPFAGGCEEGFTSTTPPPGGGGGGGGGGGVEQPIRTTVISVVDDAFSPHFITVAPGANVTWTWLGSNLHDINWVAVDLPGTGLTNAGSHEVVMPTVHGDYEFYCSEHGSPGGGMHGIVRVEPQP